MCCLIRIYTVGFSVLDFSLTSLAETVSVSKCKRWKRPLQKIRGNRVKANAYILVNFRKFYKGDNLFLLLF